MGLRAECAGLRLEEGDLQKGQPACNAQESDLVKIVPLTKLKAAGRVALTRDNGVEET